MEKWQNLVKEFAFSQSLGYPFLKIIIPEEDYMKKGIIVLAMILAIAAVPAFAQIRFNSALATPLAAGTWDGTEFKWGSGEFGSALIPVPMAGVHFQIPLGFIKLGVGVRAMPMMMMTMGWTNVYAEVNLGPVIIEGQVGGGLVGAYIPGNPVQFEFGNTIIPDVSVWLALGKTRSLRLGGGLVGMTTFKPGEIESAIPGLIALYGGVKLVVTP